MPGVFRRTREFTRLVLWNVDLTLVDVGQVTRYAFADAFQAVIGRPLLNLAPMAGRADSEVIFETLALNRIEPSDHHLPEFTEALAAAFAARREELRETGRVLPGAREALASVRGSEGVVQSVLTGSIEPNTVAKLAAFELERFLDLDIGGYGSELYPKATLLQVARSRAIDKYGPHFDEQTTVLVSENARDVQAARIAGASVIAVASGRSTEAELRSEGADVVLSDLGDTDAVVEAVRELTERSSEA